MLDAAVQRRHIIAVTVILRAGLVLLAASHIWIIAALSVGPALLDQGQIAFVSRDHHDKQETLIEMDIATRVRVNLITDSDLRDVSPRWSPDCREIAFVSFRDGNWEIYTLDALTRHQQNLTNHASQDVSISWSPDSRKMAFISNRAGRLGHYLMNRDGSTVELLAPLTVERALAWSPDGNQFAFWANYAGMGLYMMNASQPDRRTRLVEIEYFRGAPIWSRDGEHIVFDYWNFSQALNWNSEIAALDVRDSAIRILTDNRADDESPDLSPDGRLIVFLSRPKDETLFQIHVMDIDGSNRRQLTHYAGYLTYPRWSPDGRHIAFLGSREDRMKLFVMDADGSHLRQISTDDDDLWMLAWRPICS